MATAEELWAAAARSALAAEEEEEAEVEIADGDEMAVEEGQDEDAAAEGITPEEEAEAARLVEADFTGEEVEVEADVVDDPPAMAVTAEEVEIDVEAPPAPPPPRPVQPRPEAARPPSSWVAPSSTKGGKAGGKGWKGAPGPKGKGKGGGKQPRSETYYGLVHQVGEKTGNMLVKSWKVSELYGQEAMIPKLANPSGAVLGDKISFEVMERPDGARPLAMNVQVRGHIDLSAQQAGGPPAELRRQVLYYLSDDNLKTDKFFQDVIARNEGGWINMAVILGCPRMKQMKATTEGVFAALRDCPEVELQEAPGEEAIRRTSPPPPLEVASAKEWGGGAPAKGRGKGRGAAGGAGPASLTPPPPAPPVPTPSPAPAAPDPAPAQAPVAQATASDAAADATGASAGDSESSPGDELYYVGVVKSQMRMEPRKFFITSDEITKVFNRDAYFLPKQQPKGVEVGSLVVFSVPASAEVGFSPHASFVGRLAPLGSLGREDAQDPQKNGDIAKAPGVQKTIAKKGGGR